MRSSPAGEVRISIEETPESLESNWSAIWPLATVKRTPRGPVRLVVDMPGNPAQSVILGIASAVALLPLAFLAWAVPAVDELYMLRVIVVVLGIAAIWLVARERTRRERLRIDSRFVSFSVLGGDAVFHRREFTGVHVPPHGEGWLANTWWGRATWPTIVWGPARDARTDFTNGVGRGLDRETAERVVNRIREFCADVPPEGAAVESIDEGLAV